MAILYEYSLLLLLLLLLLLCMVIVVHFALAFNAVLFYYEVKQASVVYMVDSAIQQIIHSPVDNFQLQSYSLVRDLSRQ